MRSENRLGTVLGIVPARGGSKGIPRKNLRLLAGTPLLQYTARTALASSRLSRVLLSTDDPEIAALGAKVGLEVPFLRPRELAADSTPMIDVVLHAYEWVKREGRNYDALCVLQPTSPLRSANTIDRCVSLLFEREVDSVISVRPVPLEFNPHWVYLQSDDGLLRPSTGGREIPCRQQLPDAYHADGSVFVSRTQAVMEQHSLKANRLLGFVSPEEEAVDLDCEEQWAALERRLAFARASAASKSAD